MMNRERNLPLIVLQSQHNLPGVNGDLDQSMPASRFGSKGSLSLDAEDTAVFEEASKRYGRAVDGKLSPM
jgi:hypothetical protein